MSASLPATRRVFLRPIATAAGAASFADGTQLFEMVELDVLAWSSSTIYALGTHVAGSDGHIYASVLTNNKGINPVGDAGVHWKQLV